MKRHWYWSTWIMAFFIGEGVALKTKAKVLPTLSRETRLAFRVGKRGESISRGFFMALSFWFFFHIFKKAEKVMDKMMEEVDGL